MSKEVPTPYACIRATPGGSHTLCARFPDKSEFVFEDADHAADHYMGTKNLRVCGSCADEHHRKKAAEASGVAESGAIRGVNDR
jgi:hypothetical protein